MIYRITYQKFLTHMIDYFTYDEILGCQYLVFSAKIIWQSRVTNGAKVNDLWPPSELFQAHEESASKLMFEQEYFNYLDKSATGGMRKVVWSGAIIYKNLVEPYLNHDNIIIICDEKEQFVVDAFCKYIDKRYALKVIDLNTLFSKDTIGPIEVDYDLIRNRAVDIRRAAGNDMSETLSQTREGRLFLMSKMNTKEKIKLLRENGIKVNDRDKKHLDELVTEIWVDDAPDEQ